LGFDSAWEIDVFGRIRNEVKAASANVRSVEEDRRDVLVVLLGESHGAMRISGAFNCGSI